MKVAVASQDGVTISEHFGRSACFIVFDVDEGRLTGTQLRSGTFCGHLHGDCEVQRSDRHNGSHVDHADLVRAIFDCQVVLCRGMGWRAAEELVRNGINPMVIQGELSPQDAVQHYINGTLNPADGFCRCHK